MTQYKYAQSVLLQSEVNSYLDKLGQEGYKLHTVIPITDRNSHMAGKVYVVMEKEIKVDVPLNK